MKSPVLLLLLQLMTYFVPSKLKQGSLCQSSVQSIATKVGVTVHTLQLGSVSEPSCCIQVFYSYWDILDIVSRMMRSLGADVEIAHGDVYPPAVSLWPVGLQITWIIMWKPGWYRHISWHETDVTVTPTETVSFSHQPVVPGVSRWACDRL